MARQNGSQSGIDRSRYSVFLCGDVMTGRGIDQIMGHPSDPTLHERSVRDARTYVELAERRIGAVPRRVPADYIWGAALDELTRVDPDLRVVNLETSISTSDAHWSGKGIHYRMHPRNIDCLTAAGIDCCILANNHVLDWGYEGLDETIRTVWGAGIETAGAGRDLDEARRPAMFILGPESRFLLFAAGSPTSGVPASWAASQERPGIWLVDERASGAPAEVKETVGQFRRPGDLIGLSIHWGPNWGYQVPGAQRNFAHQMIDEAGVDLVYGHSSHHVKGLEIYQGKLIVYGCGDFITDYEGIRGYERYRGDLGLMYFVNLVMDSGDLLGLQLIPTRMEGFKINRPSQADAAWLAEIVQRESRGLETVQRRSSVGAILIRHRSE